MRFAGLFPLLAACAGAPRAKPPRQTVAPTKHVVSREPVDVLSALGETGREVSYIVPGAAQLELGGALVQAPDGAEPLEVVLLEQRGNDVRVGVRLDHARFAVWTQRARLLAIVMRDQRVEERAGGGFSPASPEPIDEVATPPPVARPLSGPAIDVVTQRTKFVVMKSCYVPLVVTGAATAVLDVQSKLLKMRPLPPSAR